MFRDVGELNANGATFNQTGGNQYNYHRSCTSACYSFICKRLESSRKNLSIFVARSNPSGAMDPRWQPAPGTVMAPGTGPMHPHMQYPYASAITNGATQGHGRQDAHWQQQYAPGAGTVSTLPPADHHWQSSGSRPMPERASTDGVNHPTHYKLCLLLITHLFRSLDRCLAESVN